jgi:hypothetical protein
MSFPVAPIAIFIQEDMDVFDFTEPIHFDDASMGIIRQAPGVRLHCPIKISSTAHKKQMTGVRCPNCAKNGQEVWVIPGRACGTCGTGC